MDEGEREKIEALLGEVENKLKNIKTLIKEVKHRL